MSPPVTPSFDSLLQAFDPTLKKKKKKKKAFDLEAALGETTEDAGGAADNANGGDEGANEDGGDDLDLDLSKKKKKKKKDAAALKVRERSLGHFRHCLS